MQTLLGTKLCIYIYFIASQIYLKDKQTQSEFNNDHVHIVKRKTEI